MSLNSFGDKNPQTFLGLGIKLQQDSDVNVSHKFFRGKCQAYLRFTVPGVPQPFRFSVKHFSSSGKTFFSYL